MVENINSDNQIMESNEDQHFIVNKKPQIITSYVISLILVLIIAFLGYQNFQLKEQLSSLENSQEFLEQQQPIADVVQPDLTIETPTNDNWETFTSTSYPNLSFWKQYILNYPSNWNLEEISRAPAPNYYITLTSPSGDNLVITQKETGFGTCIFEDDARYSQDLEGMYVKSKLVREVPRNDGEIWKIASINDLKELNVCSLFSGTSEYVSITPVGMILTEHNSEDGLKQIIEILKSIDY